MFRPSPTGQPPGCWTLYRHASLNIPTPRAMPLHKAIQDGNEELVVSLVEDGASVSDIAGRGDTPLHIAASEGSVATTLLLLQSGADKDSRDGTKKTPLHRAAIRLHAPVVRALMEAGADCTLLDENGQSPFCLVSGDWYGAGSPDEVVKTMIELGVAVNLHHAIKFGANEEASVKFGVSEELAASLVEDGASINVKDSQGNTPLHIAASAGGVGIMPLLLHRGAEKDSRNILLQTPLHRAAYKLHAPVVQILTDAGADATTQDMHGNTPLVAALTKGEPIEAIAEVVETMIGAGLDLKCHDPGPSLSPFHKRSSPLHQAVLRGLDDCVSLLITAGADPNALDSEAQTPLHVAARKGSLGVVLALLSSGADPNLRDKRQQTPLHRAARYADARVVRALMKGGADAALRAYGNTPLTVALADRSPTHKTPEVVKAFIEFGADVNCIDSDGWFTPLHAAVHRGDNYPYPELDECIDILLAAGANIEARNPKGQTPLNFGAARIQAVRSLVGRGADVNTQDKEGSTPLHRSKGDNATHYFNMDCVETVDFLLEAGADETLLDDQGRTAADRIETDPWGCDLDQVPRVKEEIKKACEVLASAPWRRRALLIMCVARHRRGEAELLDDPPGSADHGWTCAVASFMAMESEKQGIFQMIVGYL